VFLGHRAADVRGGEDGEDERLQNGYEELETDQHDRDRDLLTGSQSEVVRTLVLNYLAQFAAAA
jgi:hypothetical protein